MHKLDIIKNENRRDLGRPITGVIHKDRIWEQWYDKEVFDKKLPQMSQKDYLFECIGDEPDRVILNYRNKRTFTVKQFKEYIELFERAFLSLKLNIGDIVCTIGLNTPELYAIKYSSTNQGLITCNLNILDLGIKDGEHNRLFNEIKSIKPKVIFVLDIFEEKLLDVLNHEMFDSILKINMPLDFSAKFFDTEKNLLRMKACKDRFSGKKINGVVQLKEFLKYGRDVINEQIKSKYTPKQPCNISFTSGTTGVNKGVLLSHDANNALAFQQINGSLGFPKGTKHLALLPPFLAFWDADITHTTLCVGTENILELKLDYENIPKYIKKYDAEGGIWPQYLWNSIDTLKAEDAKAIGKNLKFAIVGGERCDVKELEKFYSKTGVVQMAGFGASEVNTTFSITHPRCNKVGTAGIPLPFNNIKIVDEDGNDVTYGVRGRLFISSPCLMNEYYNRPELTEKAISIDEDGVRWYCTGDYAVVDEDGCLTVIDRYKEPVTFDEDGRIIKVNLLDLVEDIRMNPNIKYCKATYANSKIVLHLSLEKAQELNREAQIKDVINTIKNNVQSEKWPHIVLVYDDLPRTSVGKVDYKKLDKITVDKTNNLSNERLIVLGMESETI